ncbi:MAG: nucleoside deaminase [Deltaproteobacteria bacterium]|nr:nucleoside deaminase [Deltaproteobacteria bacterium]
MKSHEKTGGKTGKERDDHYFIREALKEARKAASRDEVPVGAVITHNGAVIARAHNRREEAADPTSHAELTAIRKAAKRLNSWRLTGTTLFVTLEPCLMCMGAILQARIPRIVFATFDPKAGACGSLYDLSCDRRLNHRVHVTSGVAEGEAKELLKGFFKRLRTGKKNLKGPTSALLTPDE